MSWMPRLRNVSYSPRPPEIPLPVYNEAVAAKKFYNEQWEFWVYEEAQRNNLPLPKVEDACIRGLQKAIFQIKFVWGDKIARWYEDYLDMGDIFRKVNHPTYLNQLGD